jgi:hypothetical protein
MIGATLDADLLALRATPVGALEGHFGAASDVLTGEHAVLAGRVSRALGARAQVDRLDPELEAALVAHGELVLSWAKAMAGRSELFLAPLVEHAFRVKGLDEPARVVLRARLRHGPHRDVFACAALGLDDRWLGAKEDRAIAARFDLLLWRAGTYVERQNALGRWMLGGPRNLRRFVVERVRGNLREQSLAARALAIGVDGLREKGIRPEREIEIVRAAEHLATHAEPVVWFHAVRAIGRLIPISSHALAIVERWRGDERYRRRAITALACVPDDAPIHVGREVQVLLRDRDPWSLAALGPAIPILASEHRALWDLLVAEVESNDARLEVLFSVAQGLMPLARAGDRRARELSRVIEDRATRSPINSSSDGFLAASILRDTHLGLGGDAKGLDAEAAADAALDELVEFGRERAGRDALVRARAVAFEDFADAQPKVTRERDPRARGAAVFRAEAAVRTVALDLARVGFALRPDDTIPTFPEKSDFIDEATSYLATSDWDFTAARAAFRAIGLAFDGRSDRRTVAAIIDALSASDRTSKRKGSHDRDKALLFARLVERAAPQEREVIGLARVAAWWLLAGHAPSVLDAVVEPRVAANPAVGFVVSASTALADVFLVTDPREQVRIGARLEAVIRNLHIDGTRLHQALSLLASVLADGALALEQPTTRSIHQALEALAKVVPLVREAIGDPIAGLGPHDGRGRALEADPELRAQIESGRDSELIAADWASGLGRMTPVVQAMIEALFESLAQRSSTSPASIRFGRYEAIGKLGGSGMGDVWLVRDHDTGVHRVVKTVRGALEEATEAERRWLEHSLVNEASVMLGLRHTNVVRVFGCDFGGDPPYVVMEYLEGLDLEHFRLHGGPLSIAELKPIVSDVCRGLQELHSHGVVHRDMKPSNVFLRLERSGRSPNGWSRLDRVKDAVVIDFGTAWQWNPSRTGEQPMICGTFGFLPPEAIWLRMPGPKSDVYSLAATVYYSIMGVGFFPRAAEAENARAAYLYLHANEEPLANDFSVQGLSAPLASLLRAATRLDVNQRIDMVSFARAFDAL